MALLVRPRGLPRGSVAAGLRLLATRPTAAARQQQQQQQHGNTANSMSEEAFIARRHADLAQLRAAQGAQAVYPTYVSPVGAMRVADVRGRYEALVPNKDDKLRDVRLTVQGRLVKKREAGSKLVFYGVRDGTGELQVLVSASNLEAGQEKTAAEREMEVARRLFHRGDIAEVEGFPGRTATGELSVFATRMRMLAPCIHPLPLDESLKDPERRSRERHLDMIVNASSREVFKLRSQVVSEVRRFLESHDFLEVETPIMSTTVGGAAAKPFETKANALGLDMRLRISPELYLKRLVIGGFDRVFEIGKQFRNEGIDATHNPEFTTCEFYQAYANYQDLMKMTEDMLNGIAQKVKGTSIVAVQNKQGQMVEVNFAGPYQVIDIVSRLKERLHLSSALPDFNDPNSVPRLLEICKERDIFVPTPHTPSRILDHLVGLYIEPMCQQPTFLCNHPLAISPLAKEHPTEPGLTSRFELIVAGRELVNAYSELNDPTEQRARFAQQAKDRTHGDDEAHETDADFCEALEYGLPPTGGWGLGVDRLVMMLSGSTHIRDVLLFPVLRPRT